MQPRSDWRWFSVEGGEPEWVTQVRDALTPVSDALPWVEQARAAWEREQQLPPSQASLPRNAGKLWLLEPPLRAVRDRLIALGFELEGEPHPVSASFEFGPEAELIPRRDARGRALDEIRAEEGPWAVWRRGTLLSPVAEGVQRPYPLVNLDAYQPANGIGIEIEWERDQWRYFAMREVSFLEDDVQFIVLARRHRAPGGPSSFAASQDIMERVFGDQQAVENIARKLPLRGVLLVGI